MAASTWFSSVVGNPGHHKDLVPSPGGRFIAVASGCLENLGSQVISSVMPTSSMSYNMMQPMGPMFAMVSSAIQHGALRKTTVPDAQQYVGTAGNDAPLTQEAMTAYGSPECTAASPVLANPERGTASLSDELCDSEPGSPSPFRCVTDFLPPPACLISELAGCSGVCAGAPQSFADGFTGRTPGPSFFDIVYSGASHFQMQPQQVGVTAYGTGPYMCVPMQTAAMAAAVHAGLPVPPVLLDSMEQQPQQHGGAGSDGRQQRPPQQDVCAFHASGSRQVELALLLDAHDSARCEVCASPQGPHNQSVPTSMIVGTSSCRSIDQIKPALSFGSFGETDGPSPYASGSADEQVHEPCENDPLAGCTPRATSRAAASAPATESVRIFGGRDDIEAAKAVAPWRAKSARSGNLSLRRNSTCPSDVCKCWQSEERD